MSSRHGVIVGSERIQNDIKEAEYGQAGRYEDNGF